MHKAALQGVKDVKAQFGKAMLSLAGVMLAFALGAAGFKTWILFAWPQTTGTVVDSVLTTNRSGDGTTACAAVESVQYVVDGQSLLLRNGERSQTKDCAQVQAGLDAVRGQIRRIAYNKSAPESTYMNPGFNPEFYRDTLVLGRIGILLGIMGWAAIQSNRRMLKREEDRA
jgi:hypothetical protein